MVVVGAYFSAKLVRCILKNSPEMLKARCFWVFFPSSTYEILALTQICWMTGERKIKRGSKTSGLMCILKCNGGLVCHVYTVERTLIRVRTNNILFGKLRKVTDWKRKLERKSQLPYCWFTILKGKCESINGCLHASTIIVLKVKRCVHVSKFCELYEIMTIF